MVDVFITEYGVKISKKKERFLINSEKGLKEIPAKDVDCFTIFSPSCSITSSAVRLMLKHGINLVIANSKGTPLGIVLPSTLSGTVKARREQYLALNDERGINLAKSFVGGKVSNQATLLKTLAKSRIRKDKDLGRELFNYSDEIESKVKEIDYVEGKLDKVRLSLMNIEAEAAKSYWEAIEKVVPDEFEFKGRVKPRASDPFNCMLNFAYKALLFSDVWRAVIYSGLDPYAGFLHSDRSGRASLVLDLMEEFRQQAVDRVILGLISKREVGAKDVLEDGKLKKGCMSLIIKSYEEQINSEVYYNNTKERLAKVIISQARRIVRFLNGFEKYEPFRIMW
jgi:CRISPR-associated protein Cas1